MCVVCHVDYGRTAHDWTSLPFGWHFRQSFIHPFGRSLQNFLPKNRRGEGNPGPWLLFVKDGFGGLEVEVGLGWGFETRQLTGTNAAGYLLRLPYVRFILCWAAGL